MMGWWAGTRVALRTDDASALPQEVTMLVVESSKSRRSRGEVPERWSLAAVVTADVSRAEFFYLARNCFDPARSRYLE